MDAEPDCLNLAEIEREMCRLPEISAARIVVDSVGRPTEIHIVARPDKTAKQVVRDVQSIALASFGLEVDRRIVSVVLLEEPLTRGAQGADATHAPRPPTSRTLIKGINAEAAGMRSTVRVVLELADEQATGFAEGSIAAASRHRLVAAATLDALRQLSPAAEGLDLDSAQTLRLGATDVALVTVVHVQPPIEQMISGSAVVHQSNEADAVARAVLDATNRRLSLLC